MRNIVASIPAGRDPTEDVALSDELVRSGIIAIREGETVTFLDVRNDQRAMVTACMDQMGLSYDPVESFRLL